MRDRFPCEAVLNDGKRVLLRRFNETDENSVYAFFESLPEDMRRMAWHDLSNRAVIRDWARDLNYDDTLPILAIDGIRVVADATLHYRHRGPLRLVGRIRWFVDTAYRGCGLETLLVNELIGVARTNGLRHLSCVLATKLEGAAIEVLLGLGFVPVNYPGYGTDPDGNPHDMTHLTLKVS